MTSSAPPPFDRDKFLLRQQHLSIQERYEVWDEAGNSILFLERPRHVIHSIGALLAGLVAGGLVLFLVGGLADSLGPGAASGLLFLLAGLGGVATLIAVAVGLSPLRHLTVYRDRTKAESLLTVYQDKRFQPIIGTFTVRDADGSILGRLAKNHWIAIIRKQWRCTDRQGRLLLVIQEDSLLKSLLRRFLGPLFGALRTNFVFEHADSDTVVGMFNRQFTILDRYVLDMSKDVNRRIDRRLALAAGAMLDTGERR